MSVSSLVDRRAFFAGLIAIPPALISFAAFADDPAGRVNTAKGRATGLLNGALRELQARSDVYLQELLQTGAGARLGMELGRTRVDLGERTRLKIEKSLVDRGGQLLLERGALLFDRPDDEPEAGLVVRTPFAIVAARGTRFFIGPSKDVIGVFVERGSVRVRNNAGAVTLDAGEGTDLTSPDIAPTPPARWGAPRIAAALASVS